MSQKSLPVPATAHHVSGHALKRLCGSSSSQSITRRESIVGLTVLTSACCQLGAAAAPASSGPISKQLLEGNAIENPGVGWALTNKGRQLFYPEWLQGQWAVQAAFAGVEFPQGQKFLSRTVPGTLKASMIAVLSDVGAAMEGPLAYKMQFVSSSEGGTVADRGFNIEQQANTFLGYPAVRRVDYEPLKNPTRLAVVYATPRKQRTEISEDIWKAEVFINNRSSESPTPDTFLCTELYRQVTQGPRQGFVGDYMLIAEYNRQQNGQVIVRQKVAAFLQPQDPLYFEAGNKAVAVYNYTLSLTPDVIEAS